MPEVDGKHYPYPEEDKQDAKEAEGSKTQETPKTQTSSKDARDRKKEFRPKDVVKNVGKALLSTLPGANVVKLAKKGIDAYKESKKDKKKDIIV